MNIEAEKKAADIRIRAERRAGELLIKMKEDGERRGKGQPKEMSNDTTLLDLGITRDQSSQWQAVAKILQDDFEEGIKQLAFQRLLLRDIQICESGRCIELGFLVGTPSTTTGPASRTFLLRSYLQKPTQQTLRVRLDRMSISDGLLPKFRFFCIVFSSGG